MSFIVSSLLLSFGLLSFEKYLGAGRDQTMIWNRPKGFQEISSRRMKPLSFNTYNNYTRTTEKIKRITKKSTQKPKSLLESTKSLLG